jgi:hypothetical protein
MNASPPRKQRLTLFTTVLSLFLMVALLVGTAVTVTNYIETRQTAIKVADDTFRSTVSRINERRLAFFTPAYLLTTILRNAPSFQTSDGSKDAIRQLILTSTERKSADIGGICGLREREFLSRPVGNRSRENVRRTVGRTSHHTVRDSGNPHRQ